MRIPRSLPRGEGCAHGDAFSLRVKAMSASLPLRTITIQVGSVFVPRLLRAVIVRHHRFGDHVLVARVVDEEFAVAWATVISPTIAAARGLLVPPRLLTRSALPAASLRLSQGNATMIRSHISRPQLRDIVRVIAEPIVAHHVHTPRTVPWISA